MYNFLKKILPSLEESKIENIAYASCFVDYNEDYKDFIIQRLPEKFKNKRYEEKNHKYSPICTAHNNLDNMLRAVIFDKKEDFKKVYTPFHFFPQINQGKITSYTTAPNPKLLQFWIKEEFDKVKKSKEDEIRDCFRLGILLHSYMDSFVHNDFVGFHHKINKVYKIKYMRPKDKEWRKVNRFRSALIPSIGHAKVESLPDTGNLLFSFYKRLEKGEVAYFLKDTNRFKEAFVELGKILTNNEIDPTELPDFEDSEFTEKKFDFEKMFKKSLVPANLWAKLKPSGTDPFLGIFRKKFFYKSQEYFIFQEEALKIREQVLSFPENIEEVSK